VRTNSKDTLVAPQGAAPATHSNIKQPDGLVHVFPYCLDNETYVPSDLPPCTASAC